MPEFITPTTKTFLLDLIRSEKELLDSLWEGLPESQVMQPAFENDWSIKDMLAHITAWEKVAHEIVQSVLNEKDLSGDIGRIFADIDGFNATVFKGRQKNSLAAITQEYGSTHEALVNLVESLAESFIFSNLPYEGVANRTVQYIISANTHWHYQEHRVDIEKWLADSN